MISSLKAIAHCSLGAKNSWALRLIWLINVGICLAILIPSRAVLSGNITCI
ncbi:hypothetical protein THIOM_000182 [Candidatus Thiomargarita nelsonii]|uniref:Uncharacterized protein n=1 Tax=Candidatus Thiomargarita nelsonii TaxID=1003181 RepID=A0A176S773_9GAMM|nr:hypothetical protein THIOM_000182 [Candidatus Thiomargarita nelsonii]